MWAHTKASARDKEAEGKHEVGWGEEQQHPAHYERHAAGQEAVAQHAHGLEEGAVWREVVGR